MVLGLGDGGKYSNSRLFTIFYYIKNSLRQWNIIFNTYLIATSKLFISYLPYIHLISIIITYNYSDDTFTLTLQNNKRWHIYSKNMAMIGGYAWLVEVGSYMMGIWWIKYNIHHRTTTKIFTLTSVIKLKLTDRYPTLHTCPTRHCHLQINHALRE